MLKLLFCISLFLLSLTLQGQPEYDIILLAPKGQELTTRSEKEDSWLIINDAEYVGGALRIGNGYETLAPFLYHKDLGFHLIPIPKQGIAGHIKAINKHGIAIGAYLDPNYENMYEKSPYRYFVYNAHSQECYDLFDRFGVKDLNELFYNKYFKITPSYFSYISDANQLILKCEYSSCNSKGYIFDLNNEFVLPTLVDDFVKANSEGHMIGMKTSFDHDTETILVESSWFFNPNTGKQEIGSLDIFGRWKVMPEILSSNGIVAGIGRNSHFEEKGFIWSPSEGFTQFDIPEYSSVDEINDKGHLIGNFEPYSAFWDNFDSWDLDSDETSIERSAFLFTPENGLMILGSQWNVTEAFAINNHTQVVGTFENPKERAFIWDSENGMRDLNSLIPKNTGWKVLKDAIDINDSGCIVGFGKYYGIEHSFLLIPRSKRGDDLTNQTNEL